MPNIHRLPKSGTARGRGEEVWRQREGRDHRVRLSPTPTYAYDYSSVRRADECRVPGDITSNEQGELGEGRG